MSCAMRTSSPANAHLPQRDTNYRSPQRSRSTLRGLGDDTETREDDQRGTRGTRRDGSTTNGNHEGAKTPKNERSNAETAEHAETRQRRMQHEDTGDDDQRGTRGTRGEAQRQKATTKARRTTIDAEPAEHAETVNNDKATTETRIHRQVWRPAPLPLTTIQGLKHEVRPTDAFRVIS